MSIHRVNLPTSYPQVMMNALGPIHTIIFEFGTRRATWLGPITLQPYQISDFRQTDDLRVICAVGKGDTPVQYDAVSAHLNLGCQVHLYDPRQAIRQQLLDRLTSPRLQAAEV